MISFEAGSNWYEARNDLHHFHGYHDGRVVRCVISQIAVAALSADRCRYRQPKDTFDAVAHSVFAVAEFKLRANGRNSHGVIAINSLDLAHLNPIDEIDPSHCVDSGPN